MGGKFKVPQKLWTKYFILIIIYSLLTTTSNYMIITGIPLYAMYIGGDKSIAGLMLGIFTASAILTRPLFGMLLDSKSRRLVLIIGAVTCTIIYFSYLFAFSVGIVLFLRALNGIGFSANTNASGTVISDVIPKSRLAEGVGYYGIANVLATATGPALSLFIISNYSYRVLFITAFIIGIFCIICSKFLDYEKQKDKGSNTLLNELNNIDKSVKETKNLLGNMFEKTALPTALVIVFLATTVGGIMTFVPTYAATLGIENVGVYFTVYALALLFTRLFAGKLADRHGISIVILPGMLFMVSSFVILAFAKSLPIFLISAALYGIGYGSTQPTLNANMIRYCPKERRGAGNSTFFTAMDIGSGGGAVIWGVIAQNIGFTWVYLACAASVLISLLLYIFVLQRQLKNKLMKIDCYTELSK